MVSGAEMNSSVATAQLPRRRRRSSRAQLESAFARHGFALHTWIDTPDEIFIEATR